MRLEYFELIDRVTDLDYAASRIQAQAQVPLAGPVFEGHFPGHPLMPGVLLIEAMAQTAGWLLGALHDMQRMPFLAAVKEAKLRQFVKPGETLMLSAHLVHDGSGYALTEAAIAVDGKTVCNAQITLRLLPFPDENFQRMMRRRAEQIALPMRANAHG